MDFNQDKLGMRVTSGSVVLQKDSQNLIGISIGGGGPYCPCLYVVQIFDNTPAALNGVLASGDEITGVDRECVKNRTKVDVARLIQSHKKQVTIFYNKLHADPAQGMSLDIILKKMKHQMVESMTSTAADTLGLSRAILVNDTLVKKLQELTETCKMFSLFMFNMKRVLKATFELSLVHRAFGEVFADIGVKEPQPLASEAFSDFGKSHRSMEKFAVDTLKKLKPLVQDLGTFLKKVIPDMRMTLKKYLDVKFEYLSYCLKVKEMDDEEYSYQALREPLYRVETGNYEYRLILRCRQDARSKFAKLRNDVMVKLELVDNKHVQDMVTQLQRFINTMRAYHEDSYNSLKATQIFPIEFDLNLSKFPSREAQSLAQSQVDDDPESENIEIESLSAESLWKSPGVKEYRDDPTEDVPLEKPSVLPASWDRTAPPSHQFCDVLGDPADNRDEALLAIDGTANSHDGNNTLQWPTDDQECAGSVHQKPTELNTELSGDFQLVSLQQEGDIRPSNENSLLDNWMTTGHQKPELTCPSSYSAPSSNLLEGFNSAPSQPRSSHPTDPFNTDLFQTSNSTTPFTTQEPFDLLQ